MPKSSARKIMGRKMTTTKMSERLKMAKAAEKKEKETNAEQVTELAEYKYIGDDGGRWVFERRADRRVITIDKPGVMPQGNPSNKLVMLIAHGFRVPESVIAICKK
jgi:hypothetical protein